MLAWWRRVGSRDAPINRFGRYIGRLFPWIIGYRLKRELNVNLFYQNVNYKLPSFHWFIVSCWVKIKTKILLPLHFTRAHSFSKISKNFQTLAVMTEFDYDVCSIHNPSQFPVFLRMCKSHALWKLCAWPIEPKWSAFIAAGCPQYTRL